MAFVFDLFLLWWLLFCLVSRTSRRPGLCANSGPGLDGCRRTPDPRPPARPARPGAAAPRVPSRRRRMERGHPPPPRTAPTKFSRVVSPRPTTTCTRFNHTQGLGISCASRPDLLTRETMRVCREEPSGRRPTPAAGTVGTPARSPDACSNPGSVPGRPAPCFGLAAARWLCYTEAWPERGSPLKKVFFTCYGRPDNWPLLSEPRPNCRT